MKIVISIDQEALFGIVRQKAGNCMADILSGSTICSATSLRPLLDFGIVEESLHIIVLQVDFDNSAQR